MKSTRTGLVAGLFRPVDASSLGAFRIVFGLVLLMLTVKHWPLLQGHYMAEQFTFAYPGLDFIRPLAGQGMYVLFVVMGVSAVGVALGLYYRLSAVVLCLTYNFYFHCNAAHYQNHTYLIALLTLVMIFLGADRWAALKFGARCPRSTTVPFWQVALLRAQIVIVYFYGGLAKFDYDWLHGEPVGGSIPGRIQAGSIPAFLESLPLGLLISYGGLVFDLLIGWLLLGRGTRKWAFIGVVLFNLLNLRLFVVGVFPYLMIGALVLFVDPRLPRALINLVGVRLGRGSCAARTKDTYPVRPVVLGLLCAYMLVQVLLPFRHFLYPGNTSWTGEGHRYAWRMKLVNKRSFTLFRVTDPKSGESYLVDLTRHMHSKHVGHLVTSPDNIPRFARHLRADAQRKGITDAIVTAHILCSMNGRTFQYMIEPDIDLAECVYSPFRHATWIRRMDPDGTLGVYPRDVDLRGHPDEIWAGYETVWPDLPQEMIRGGAE